MGKNSTTKKMNMQYSAHLSNIVTVNDSFDRGQMRIAYHGQNRNGSKISKQSFEDNLMTLAYVPIVANYKIRDDKIGSHDSEYIENSEGELKEYNITMPLGLVPENFKWNWEEVIEKDGSLHEYLCTEVLLWKRQPVYEHIIENGVTDQSMEISVSEGEFDQNGYYDITKFTFTALCLLESAEPCFESAALHTYSEDSFSEQCNKMYEEFKLLFSNQPSVPEVEIKKQEKEENGLDKLGLIKEYGFEPDALDFNFEELDEAELKAKLEEMKSDAAEPESDKAPENDFALSSQFQESLYEAMSSEKIETEYGMYSRYATVDYDMEASEVYAYDREDYKLYGFPYTVSGDVVSVDFACKKKKKYAIVDFNEGDAEFSLEEFTTPLVETAVAAIQSELDTKDSELASLKAELDELSEYRNSKEAEAKDAILTSDAYARLSDDEEFKKLVTDAESYTAEEIETKADLLLAKHIKKAGNFSLEKPEKPNNRVPFSLETDVEEKPYGDLFKGIE